MRLIGYAAACALTFCAAVAPNVACAQDVPPPARRTVRLVDVASVPREVIDEVLRIVNSGATLRVTGTSEIAADQVIDRDVAVLEGDLTVSGRIQGKLVALNGDVLLRRGARIDGGVILIGGRLDGKDDAEVLGDIQVYQDRVSVAYEGETPLETPQEDDERWWRHRSRWRDRSWSDLRLVSARTYNRVEGLPMMIGPAFGRDVGWGRLTVEAMGIVRSVGSFAQTSDNVGHSVKLEAQLGRNYGVRVGGRLFDMVEAVERWHLSDAEVGLAAFFLHRDFSDYYNRHGGAVYASAFVGGGTDISVSYSDLRWGARSTKNPLTLFRNNHAWRPNPLMDEGTFHVLNGVLRFDTRNDDRNPRSGWFITADYEFGTGTISRYAPTSPDARMETVSGRTQYDRLLLDVRSYNRVSPDGQLDLRLVVGGWLSGDDLPLQRRFSVGGPGTLPGYGFRRSSGADDVFQCSGGRGLTPPALGVIPGAPAQCERVALAQVEYRGTFDFDPFGVVRADRGTRRRGWGRDAEWVVFADAGRGWLVGGRRGELIYPSGDVPSLGTFRTDVGIGLRLDDLGLYVAKAVSEKGTPLHFFVRLRPRF